MADRSSDEAQSVASSAQSHLRSRSQESASSSAALLRQRPPGEDGSEASSQLFSFFIPQSNAGSGGIPARARLEAVDGPWPALSASDTHSEVFSTDHILGEEGQEEEEEERQITEQSRLVPFVAGDLPRVAGSGDVSGAAFAAASPGGRQAIAAAKGLLQQHVSRISSPRSSLELPIRSSLETRSSVSGRTAVPSGETAPCNDVEAGRMPYGGSSSCSGTGSDGARGQRPAPSQGYGTSQQRAPTSPSPHDHSESDGLPSAADIRKASLLSLMGGAFLDVDARSQLEARTAGSKVLVFHRQTRAPYWFASCRDAVAFVTDEMHWHEAREFDPRTGRPLQPGPYWIDVQQPSSAIDFLYLARFLNLHELTIEDCLEFDAAEKFEHFAQQAYSFVVLNLQELDQSMSMELTPMNFILTAAAVVTVHKKPLHTMVDVLSRVRKDFPSPSFILYAFFDALVDDIVPLTDAALDDCETIEEIMTVASRREQSDLLVRIGLARKRLTSIRRILSAKQKLASYLTSCRTADPAPPPVARFAVPPRGLPIVHQQPLLQVESPHAGPGRGAGPRKLHNLGKESAAASWAAPSVIWDASPSEEGSAAATARGTSKAQAQPYLGSAFANAAATEAFISGETRLYLRDVLDHVSSCIHKVDIGRDVLNHAHQSYLARVSVLLAQSANDTNLRVKKLTLLATAIMPISVVSSIWGMNCTVPFNTTDYPDTLAPFFVILAVTVSISVIAVLLYLHFSRQSSRTNARGPRLS